jgi:phage shock protein C
MFCNWCGKSIDAQAEFCQFCGRTVRIPQTRKLVRPQQGRKIAGVAQGIANYFDLDVALVRLVWVLVAIFGGCGLLAYVVAWIIVPSEPKLPAVASSSQPQAQAS